GGDEQPVGNRLIGQTVREPPEQLLEVERAHVGPENQQDDDEAGVADAVGDECLDGRIGCASAFVVKADEQVGANAHQFPAQKDLEEIIGQHQVEHGEAEEREKKEE